MYFFKERLMVPWTKNWNIIAYSLNICDSYFLHFTGFEPWISGIITNGLPLHLLDSSVERRLEPSEDAFITTSRESYFVQATVLLLSSVKVPVKWYFRHDSFSVWIGPLNRRFQGKNGHLKELFCYGSLTPKISLAYFLIFLKNWLNLLKD